MPTIPIPRFNDVDMNDPEDLITRLTRLSRALEYLTGHLDHDNVRRLHTEEAIIQSRYGETIINGPTLKMYSSGAAVEGSTSPGTLRLKMGYESTSGNFVFNMYAQDGSEAVSLNSTGHLKMAGKPLIEMTGDTTTVRLRMGYSTETGSSGFGFNLYNVLGQPAVTLDSTGNGVITGGVVRTASTGQRIEIRDNNFFMYNSSNQLEGLVFGSTFGTWGDVFFYNDGVKVAQFYQDINSVAFIPATTDFTVGIGKTGAYTYINGYMYHTGSKLGFFSTGPISQLAITQTASTVADVIRDKLNELINGLHRYGLFSS